MKIISFCIYGNADKYCKGLAENLVLIQNNLPDYQCFIYVGDQVPQHWTDLYSSYPFVKLFYTGRIGHDNMIDRFYAIDEPDVGIAIVRDSDSRIHERDLWCIRHFEKSEFLFHTIRDHPYHKTEIMGGLWGIKRKCLSKSIRTLYNEYNENGTLINKIQHDQQFLKNKIYPLVVSKMVVYVFHDNIRKNLKETIKRIPMNIINSDFCGLSIKYENDIPIKEYKWDINWNTPTYALPVEITDNVNRISNDNNDKSIIRIFLNQIEQIQNPAINYHIYIDNSDSSQYEQIKTHIENKLLNAIVFPTETLESNKNKYGYIGIIPMRDSDILVKPQLPSKTMFMR